MEFNNKKYGFHLPFVQAFYASKKAVGRHILPLGLVSKEFVYDMKKRKLL